MKPPAKTKIPNLGNLMLQAAMLPGCEDLFDSKGRLKPDPDFLKRERMSIRISAYDKMMLKDIAREEGMPYQTLAASILRRYVMDKLRK